MFFLAATLDGWTGGDFSDKYALCAGFYQTQPSSSEQWSTSVADIVRHVTKVVQFLLQLITWRMQRRHTQLASVSCGSTRQTSEQKSETSHNMWDASREHRVIEGHSRFHRRKIFHMKSLISEIAWVNCTCSDQPFQKLIYPARYSQLSITFAVSDMFVCISFMCLRVHVDVIQPLAARNNKHCSSCSWT